ncbi:sulfurtransferase [Pseudonocardia sp. H11422]|uniref:sulfurtransferase n=1 Tax=Pseudonocardia sp. H11422 TaxID=2835866 RepID=UPI001BDCC96E|nr:sulfurtransferase [Pseudonocardia sp. H11422]
MPALLTPADLALELTRQDPGERPVVLDVRWRLGGPPGRADHAAGHVPGAVYVDLDTELAGPPGPEGRHPLPPPEQLQAVLRRAGMSGTSRVVAYDDGNGSVAARAWWLLRWAGFAPEQVAVLDGGYAAWVAEGHPVSDSPVEPVPGDVVVRPASMPVLDADAAAELVRAGVLLDARAGARYRGETEPVDPRAGHIPGARNAPATDNVGPDGRWLGPAELAARFGELGVNGGVPVGAYCGSGVNAAALVLALEHAGLTPIERPAALYVGSWSNWSADPARPAATGAQP